MTTFKINTLGCKVNQYESQLMREQLETAGFTAAEAGPVQIYVINTCTVTSSADRQSRNLIRRVLRLNPKAKIVVAGCYAKKNAGDILNICKDAVILKNSRKTGIVGARHAVPLLGRLLPAGRRTLRPIRHISGFTGHNRCFVKIQDGCDNYCSYCKVPSVRGTPVSRPVRNILAEVKALIDNGFKEIVLCGICLGAYKDLTGLLNKLESLKALRRIRLSSIEPIYVNDELIRKIASSKKICRHLHIPLQSGNDRILKAMNRKYTAGQYIKIINSVRRQMPEVAIGTDVLVGFPDETEKKFKDTIKVLKTVSPMRTHAFTFSKRKGTPAFFMPREIEKKEKSSRLYRVKELAGRMSFLYRKKFKGRSPVVLVENKRDKKTNLLTGYTDTYIKVLFEGEDKFINELLPVEITDVSTDYTIGKIKIA